ncbi:sigma-70 family RNA polymerase sigma factor [Gloeobacter kilaueensis]|uniref:sigma-70 family RNA polymerase sigma factor n=1 Tax=Gloeobacter kilaueensis TaxID=1416614 RepID=UPI0004244316|nr:sigma-70 family RNA polymerase sigma factor [Gloeobacter kilaueensis]
MAERRSWFLRAGLGEPGQPEPSLQDLALRLQPLMGERMRLIADTALTPQRRTEGLFRLEREAERLGLRRFNQKLEQLCRAYCARKGASRSGRFDTEAFTEDVLLLTYARLFHFDPTKANFMTWLGSHILLRVYTTMQRSIDPTWQRPQATTERGRQEQWTARALAYPRSLDGVTPVSAFEPESGVDPGETIGAGEASAEAELLEEHCRERFLRALERLDDAEKALLTRAYLYGESQKEIAQSLGRTRARVCQRLRAIADKLAVLLGEDFEPDCGNTAFCAALRQEKV